MLNPISANILNKISKIEVEKQFFSSKLVNFTSKETIDKVDKTVFYSELNTNYEVGQKLFIVGGNYDSDLLIKENLYRPGTDGYEILAIDGCKITLDIKYDGRKVQNSDAWDNFIKVYVINDGDQYSYFTTGESQMVVGSFSTSVNNKFDPAFSNSIFYAYAGVNVGITQSGFYKKTLSGNTNITNTILSGSYSSVFTQTNNGRIVIINGAVTHGNNIMEEGIIYKWDSLYNKWSPDVTYMQPMITRFNFRGGSFNGLWKNGIFGSYDRESVWLSASTWKSGIFLNGLWSGGDFNSSSDSYLQKTTYAKLDENGVINISSDSSNNRGNGYNFSVNSRFFGGSIYNGTFQNCFVGLATASNWNPSFEYFGITGSNSKSIEVKSGTIRESYFYGASASKTKLYDSKINDSMVKSSTMVNNQSVYSVIDSSDLKNRNLIKVIGYDVETWDESPSTKYSCHKFYVSYEDWRKIKYKDKIYVNGTGTDLDDIKWTVGTELKVAYSRREVRLRSLSENKYLLKNGNSNSVLNPNPGYSVDLIITDKFNYILRPVEFNGDNLYISSGDFDSGIINNCNIDSDIISSVGNEIALNSPGGDYNILLNGTSSLDIYFKDSTVYPDYKYNSYRLDSLVYIDNLCANESGNEYDLSGTYRITNLDTYGIYGWTFATVILATGSSDFSYLSSPSFSCSDLTPTFNSASRLLVENSKITSGKIYRTALRNNTFYDETLDTSDTSSVGSLNYNLILKNNIFSDVNKNNIKKAYIESSILRGANVGSVVINDSIWRSGTFSSGILNDIHWYDGYFDGGIFQNSKSLTQSVDYSYILESKSWDNGTFNKGTMNNSLWFNGTFSNGKIYNSDWWGGNFLNGYFGDSYYQSSSSRFMGGTFTNGVVINSTFNPLIGNIDWVDGRFDSGLFSNPTSSNKITWYDGTFNSGEFSGVSKWVNGDFNGGNFLSTFGTNYWISGTGASYSWEGGKFNGGIFGSGLLVDNNPTWYNGEFNGGVFQGKVWNYGILHSGNFYGSSTYSARYNENQFVSSIYGTTSFYGLWRNGWVSDDKSSVLTEEEVYTKGERNYGFRKKPSVVNFKNAIWETGTFSHKGAYFDNSIWLSGSWDNGTFKRSSFNPYVERNGMSASFDLTTKWNNGTFESGNFWLSEWETGTWKTGTMSGGKFKGGTWLYGDAINTIWLNGTWRNGNWYGSPYNGNLLIGSVSGIIATGSTHDILVNNMQYYNTLGYNVFGTAGVHMWNAFSASNDDQYHPINNTVIQVYNSSPTYSSGLTVSQVSGLKLTTTKLISTIINTRGGVVDNYQTMFNRFGNGSFISGIWENGVWNSGQRIDTKVAKFIDMIGFNKISTGVWLIAIQALDVNDPNYIDIVVGDNISVGNIVMIDINGQRKYIDNKLLVTRKTDDVLTLQLKTSFPIREIKKDSGNDIFQSEHMIYASKNIWINGAFLNGKFEGVWTNGYLKGRPMISELSNTQWSNGVFDGGRFIGGTTSVYYDVEGLTFSHSTGLIQNMNFNDLYGKTRIGDTQSKYMSWLDVNYWTYSATHLYSDLLVGTAVGDYQLEVPDVGLYGYITDDILSSNSKMTNTRDLKIVDHRLGTKYEIYKDFIGGNSLVKTPTIQQGGWRYVDSGDVKTTAFENRSKFTIIPDVDENSKMSFVIEVTDRWYGEVQRHVVESEYLTNDQITIKNLASKINGIDGIYCNSKFGTAKIEIYQISNRYGINIPLNSGQNVLITSTAEKQNYTKTKAGDIKFNGYFGATGSVSILNNDLIDIEEKRYSMVSFDLLNSGVGYSNQPFTQSNVSFTSMYGDELIKHENTFIPGVTQSTGGKFEFFYNRKRLDMYNSSVSSFDMGNIKFYEVDTIPHFKYWNASNIDTRVQVPYFATAPQIDYNDSDFSFVGNITFGFDSILSSVGRRFRFLLDPNFGNFTNRG